MEVPVCSYNGRLNTTSFGLIRSYEGIPENIIVNLIVSTILIFIFVYIRRRFSDSKNIVDGTEISTILYGQNNSSRNLIQNTNWLWLRDLFKISDWDIYRNCSRDAYYYLLFHTYLIAYLIFLTLFSLTIILPVNFHGTQGISEQKFAHTTIANLPPDSPLLWVHACASILYVIAGIIVVYLYTNATQYYATEDVSEDEESKEKASRTLMIRGINRELCDEEKLNQYFREAYPSLSVADVTLVYNIARLQRVYKRRELNHRIWLQCKKMLEETGRRPIIYSNRSGKICCSKELDAIEHYEKLYNIYKQRLEDEYRHVKEKKCGLAFVTFSKSEEAHRVYSNFQATCFIPDRRPQTSTSKCLNAHQWTISFAPSSKNIIWKNIPTSEVRHWFRIIIVNIVLIFFMIFLTTPSIVMSTLDKIANKYRSINPIKNVTEQLHLPVVLTTVIPVLLLRIFASVMPALVSVTSLLEKQWKKSSLDKSMMIKLFIFLSMMILILPSLGLTSIEGFLRWVFESEKNGTHNNSIRWMCVFLPDNGAFFVNYIITSAFIGASVELLRLSDLVYYIYIIFIAKSTAERRVIRNSLQFPYRFGVQYAWTSAVFCVIVAYSIACPLITPIGLIYMIIKRAVDKYNLVFIYDSEIADRSVHRFAGNFVMVAIIIQQMTLLFFIFVRSEKLTALSMTLLVSLILTAGVYYAFSCFYRCIRCQPRKYSIPKAMLPEVSVYFLPHTIRCNLLKDKAIDTFGNRRKLDDLGELEENEGLEISQRITSNYIPTILNACIQEFDLEATTRTIHRSSTQGSYGTMNQISQEVAVGTGEENDLLTD